jgi:hypothetical protein
VRALTWRWTAIPMALVMAYVVAGCHFRFSYAPDTGGIRTFQLQREFNGQVGLCTLGLAVRPVEGTFHGDPTASRDKAWLIDASGQRIFVAWPEGFSLRFAPGAELIDDQARVVAREGDLITFKQVNREDHTGSIDDPYFAAGALFSTCYPKA